MKHHFMQYKQNKAIRLSAIVGALLLFCGLTALAGKKISRRYQERKKTRPVRIV
jgi:hypothetical protein